MGNALTQRLCIHIGALTVQTWHVHAVLAATRHDVADVVRCLKESVRYGLRPGRPIWTKGYDKRFCFDDQNVERRVRYVERHNVALGWPARPWDFIEEII